MAEQSFYSSIVENITKRNVKDIESFKAALEQAGFTSFAKSATKEELESVFKHPDIQAIVLGNIKNDQVDLLSRSIASRHPSWTKTRVNQAATAKYNENARKAIGRGAVFVQKRTGVKVTRAQRLYALRPVVRAERLVTQKARSGIKYTRTKPVIWSPKQVNFLKANKGRDLEFLTTRYNDIFKEKRSPTSLRFKIQRLRRAGQL